MPGVTTGQVFTEDELDRLLVWFVVLELQGNADLDDTALADKIRNYRNELSYCLVP